MLSPALLACLHPDPRLAADRLAATLSDPVDWETVCDQAVVHGVYPLVSRMLRAYPGSAVPDAVVTRLQAAADRNTKRMMWMAAELRRLYTVLSAAGIPCLTLKGPALAQRLYGDTGLRTAVDLDFLIASADVARVDGLLRQAGFVRFHPDPSLSARQERAVMRGMSHFAYRQADSRLIVECHWRLTPLMKREPGFDALWNRRMMVDVCGAAVAMPADPDLLAILALHGAQHAWRQLRWLCDVAGLLHQRPDLVSPAWIREVQRLRWGPVMGQTALLLRHVLGVVPPAGLDAAFAGRRRAVTLVKPALTAMRCPERLYPAGRLGDGAYRGRLYGWRRIVMARYGTLDARLLQRIRLPDAGFPLYYVIAPGFRLIQDLKTVARRRRRCRNLEREKNKKICRMQRFMVI